MMNFSVKISLEQVYADDEVYAQILSRGPIPTEQRSCRASTNAVAGMMMYGNCKSLHNMIANGP